MGALCALGRCTEAVTAAPDIACKVAQLRSAACTDLRLASENAQV